MTVFQPLIKSSYEEMKKQSSYHFNPDIVDARYDSVQYLGRFDSNFSNDCDFIRTNTQSASWRTRTFGGNTNRGNGGTSSPPNNWIEAEEYDISKFGGDPNMSLVHMGTELTPKLQKMSDMIGLSNGHDKVHMQVVGEVFNLHIDKLSRIYPEDTSKIIRIGIMLSDWEPGHFYQYGNYIYKGWKAGDIHTFDWKNVPHCTANAGRNPRFMFMTTGIITDKTREFFQLMTEYKTINV